LFLRRGRRPERAPPRASPLPRLRAEAGVVLARDEFPNGEGKVVAVAARRADGGPTSNLKVMFDRLVCMNGGNPREDLIDHKNPELAMKLEHSPEWEAVSQDHLEGRSAVFFCYGDGGGDPHVHRVVRKVAPGDPSPPLQGPGFGSTNRTPADIPQPARFVLADDAGRDRYAVLPGGRGQRHGVADAGFPGDGRNVDQSTPPAPTPPRPRTSTTSRSATRRRTRSTCRRRRPRPGWGRTRSWPPT
jgi:hypothetical protein